jgi:hypothetical protein
VSWCRDAAFDADGVLADRRQHLVLRDRDTDMTKAQPLQAGEREQRRLDLNALALGQARVDIAAQRDDLQIGAATQELGAPAQRGGADDRTPPQVGDASADTIPASVLCSLMTGRRACPFARSRLVSGLQQTLCRGNAFAVRTNACVGIEVLHRLSCDEGDRRARNVQFAETDRHSHAAVESFQLIGDDRPERLVGATKAEGFGDELRRGGIFILRQPDLGGVDGGNRLALADMGELDMQGGGDGVVSGKGRTGAHARAIVLGAVLQEGRNAEIGARGCIVAILRKARIGAKGETEGLEAIAFDQRIGFGGGDGCRGAFPLGLVLRNEVDIVDRCEEDGVVISTSWSSRIACGRVLGSKNSMR